MMLGRRRTGRAAAGDTAPQPFADEQAVRRAEEVVRRAWARELLRQRDHLEFAMRVAYEDSNAAYEALASAQRDGDPRRIGVAHAALEGALDAARKSSIACERLRRTLRAELDLLMRATRERALWTLAHQLELERIPPAAEGLEERTVPRTPETPTPRSGNGSGPGFGLAVPRFKRRFSRWLHCFAVRRTADPGPL
jgi:hypothetical protein